MQKLLLILVGVADLYFTGRFLLDPDFAKRYVLESPKAYIWRKLFGEEQAYKLIRYAFAPIGVLLGIVLVALGLAS